MTYTTLISTEDLAAHIGESDWRIMDCRFALTDPGQGRRDYQQSHIVGAVHASMDEDLSGPIIRGQTSRHPLPEVEVFAETLSRWGIDASVQVVAYDGSGGAMAARLWWMLRWLGHEAVAVLDGGWPKWQAEGRPVTDGTEIAEPRYFLPRPRSELLLQAGDVFNMMEDPEFHLFDVRSADRYRGENETLDPVAGHIPGAHSLPFAGNLSKDGTFLPAEALRARYQAALGEIPAEQTAFYCGSGVTAAHNVLAIAYAGLGEAKLYAGSWSEWITDPERPVATGED
jgi:thiosulfate/3-mercaptopyruvate sulfurtransferase